MKPARQLRYLKVYGSLFKLAFRGLSRKQLNEIDRSFCFDRLGSKPLICLSFINANKSRNLFRKTERLVEQANKDNSARRRSLKENDDFIACDKRRLRYYFSLSREADLVKLILQAVEGWIFHRPERFNSVFLHAAGVSLDGKGLIFLAPSGGGKTTIANFARNSGFKIISDELLLVKEQLGEFSFFPFPLNHILGKSRKVSDFFVGKNVAGVYFLKKGKSIGINALSLFTCLGRGFPQAAYFFNNHLTDSELQSRRRYIFAFLESFFSLVEPRELVFNKTKSVGSFLKKRIYNE
jgi:hypothetical protein